MKRRPAIPHSYRPAILYVILDTILIGAGMGVPIFAILGGFVVGLFLPRYIPPEITNMQGILKKAIRYSALTSFVTMILMFAIWVSLLPMLSDPKADFANFGIPMILFEPRASFIGWIVLMIVISPFLQFLTTLFGAVISLIRKPVTE